MEPHRTPFAHFVAASMALFSAGSSLTYHLALFVLNVMTTSLPSILLLVAFPKGLFSALYSLSCTLHLSVLLSLPFPSTTTFTQMILSSSLFHPLNFDSSISHLQDALQHISSWMTANLLTLTPPRLNSCSSDSKTNLPKYNSSLDTSHSARNLGFIFDEHLTFADQITALSKACYYHIRQLCCIRPYLDSCR